jgi:type IV fimbrial biogenesis protein FimT
MNGKYTPKRNSKVNGFTILELIVTLGILAVVLTIAIPNFQWISINGNLKTAARDLIADVNAMKQRAMANNKTYQIVFNVGGNSYTIQEKAGNPPPADADLPIIKTPSAYGNGITITSAPFGAGTTIEFQTRGTISQAGSVNLNNSRNSTATITCNLSGRNYVQFNMQ